MLLVHQRTHDPLAIAGSLVKQIFIHLDLVCVHTASVKLFELNVRTSSESKLPIFIIYIVFLWLKWSIPNSVLCIGLVNLVDLDSSFLVVNSTQN